MPKHCYNEFRLGHESLKDQLYTSRPKSAITGDNSDCSENNRKKNVQQAYDTNLYLIQIKRTSFK